MQFFSLKVDIEPNLLYTVSLDNLQFKFILNIKKPEKIFCVLLKIRDSF